MTTADEKMREDVSLLRKYAYEFGRTNDIEMHTMMLEAQKRIIDSAAQSAERIKELEQQNEQLQAQVDRLSDAVKRTIEQLSDACKRLGGSHLQQEFDMLNFDATLHIQTAEAYKRRVQAEALEAAAQFFIEEPNSASRRAAKELDRMAAELKEGE